MFEIIHYQQARRDLISFQFERNSKSLDYLEFCKFGCKMQHSHDKLIQI